MSKKPSLYTIQTAFLVVTAALLFFAPSADAQLRIVTYNTNTFGTQGLIPGIPVNHRVVRPEADIVFEAIAEESVGGIRRAPDIILLQEQQQPDTTTANLVNRLNTIFAADGITYARGFEIGNTTSGSGTGTPNGGEIRQGVVYRTDTVQLVEEDSFGDLSGGLVSQPRETVLHRFRPIGYGPDADLYLFNSHFEAGGPSNSGISENLAGRETEADQIRSYIDSNGLGQLNVIVGGDLNVDSSFETSGLTTFGGLSALELLAAPGPGRVIDPLNPAGNPVTFTNNPAFSRFLTQSPASDGNGPLVEGGIDDRFDFLLLSDELTDNEGVSVIPDTLRSFGNNGSTFNDQINDGNTIQISGLTSFSTAQVLNALEAASDHLPVVQEFQLPAVLEAMAGLIPDAIFQGDLVELNLTISNAADVQVSFGADELDFTYNSSGAVIGAGMGIDAALGSGVDASLTLDTSVVGQRSGLITVTTDSFAAANSSVSIPITFQVLAAAEPGDFNGDGAVNAADFVTYRDGASPNGLDLSDYESWSRAFGADQGPNTTVAVPEAAGGLLVSLYALLFAATTPRRIWG